MGVSQARISQIEHSKITEVGVIRGYVGALGGTVDVVALRRRGRLPRSWPPLPQVEYFTQRDRLADLHYMQEPGLGCRTPGG